MHPDIHTVSAQYKMCYPRKTNVRLVFTTRPQFLANFGFIVLSQFWETHHMRFWSSRSDHGKSDYTPRHSPSTRTIQNLFSRKTNERLFFTRLPRFLAICGFVVLSQFWETNHMRFWSSCSDHGKGHHCHAHESMQTHTRAWDRESERLKKLNFGVRVPYLPVTKNENKNIWKW